MRVGVKFLRYLGRRAENNLPTEHTEDTETPRFLSVCSVGSVGHPTLPPPRPDLSVGLPFRA
jgi:hypothetical protein